MTKEKNLRKMVAEYVYFDEYDKEYINELSIEKTIKNIFYAEKQVKKGHELEAFLEWFCGLPSCFTVPYLNNEIEKMLHEQGFTDKEIEQIDGDYLLEKLGFLFWVALFPEIAC